MTDLVLCTRIKCHLFEWMCDSLIILIRNCPGSSKSCSRSTWSNMSLVKDFCLLWEPSASLSFTTGIVSRSLAGGNAPFTCEDNLVIVTVLQGVLKGMCKQWHTMRATGMVSLPFYAASIAPCCYDCHCLVHCLLQILLYLATLHMVSATSVLYLQISWG